jgi:ATP-dependent DNA helicase RecG
VPDFIIEDRVIVELKALPFVGNTEKKQIWTYLKGSSYYLALLVNFGPRELTINRIIYERARISASGPQSSALVPHRIPHLLSMTATPIPRTLALTIYGDLDLSLLNEMPAGRKKIITEIITPDKREETYEQIRKELNLGRQLYVICPRIFEPDPEKELALNVKSAVEEAKRLKKEVFREYEIGVLHSKMSKEKKEKVMQEFSDNKLNILCATSVVEVGVNVPNATLIVIEGAERFGLAQLHQLRGRVIRSTHQAYCFIFADAKSEKTIARLKALKTAKNGFELAELDLALRGAGELSGVKQWGITDLGMEAIKNIKMVEAARLEAIRLIEEDPELVNYPLLKQKVREKAGEFHFE